MQIEAINNDTDMEVTPPDTSPPSGGGISFDESPPENIEEEEQELPPEGPGYDDPPAAAADDAPADDQPPPPSQVSFDDQQQEVFNNAMARQKGQFRQEMQEMQQTMEAQKAELEQLRTQAARPQLDADGLPPEPVMPDDIWAPDYNQKMAQYTNDVQVRAEAIARKQIEDAQQRAEEERAAAAEQQQWIDLGTAYDQKSKELRVPPADLKAAGDMISSIGIRASVVSEIMQHEHGPLITLYLGKNPTEVTKIGQMTDTAFGRYLEKEIAPKVSRTAKSRQNPPPPPKGVAGAPAGESKRGPKGATYE